MWYGSPGRVPTPLKTSAYLCNMYSFVVGEGWVLPFIVIELLHQETCSDLGSTIDPITLTSWSPYALILTVGGDSLCTCHF